ncbi:MAG: hypothetical protein RLZZ436_1752 [Planctomycetota bacterium]
MSRQLLAMLLVSSTAVACNIPVFRYALERWTADPVEVLVFHRGPLSKADQQHVQNWQQLSGDRSRANLQVVLQDVSEFENADAGADAAARRDIWLGLPEPSRKGLPCVVARSRHGRGQILNHWISPIAEAAERLADSPARSELIRRLQKGDAVVWLLVRPPQAEPTKTAALRTLLEDQCRKLPDVLELPEGIGLPGSELYSEIPLLLKFSVLELDGGDPQEAWLVRQLSGVQPDAWAAGEPLAVPVFGRGRALEVIPASRTTSDLVHDLTQFLCSACSCQVKEQNPGFDLLLHTNWNASLFGEDGELPPPPEPGTKAQDTRPKLVPIPAGREVRSEK